MTRNKPCHYSPKVLIWFGCCLRNDALDAGNDPIREAAPAAAAAATAIVVVVVVGGMDPRGQGAIFHTVPHPSGTCASLPQTGSQPRCFPSGTVNDAQLTVPPFTWPSSGSWQLSWRLS